jgi:photosystem I P700 chlorophyll a apoprotein A2
MATRTQPIEVTGVLYGNSGQIPVVFPPFSQVIWENPSTNRIWYGIAVAHDLESHDGVTEEKVYQKIFASHFGHVAVILLWLSGLLFHVSWQGNFELWVTDPLRVEPIAHAIWDPHFGNSVLNEMVFGGVDFPSVPVYSGLYHLWYTVGCRRNEDLYWWAVGLVVLAGVFLLAGWLHLKPKFRPSLAWFKNNESRLNHHLSALFGVSSLAWSGHLIHVAIPGSRGIQVRWEDLMVKKPHIEGLKPLFNGHWSSYSDNPDTLSHLFGTSEGAGTAILTFLGGLDSQSHALWLTDIAHHHLAVGVLFILAGHMYRTNWGIGHSIKDILEAHTPPSGILGSGHKGIYETLNDSLHMQLGLALASLGVITSLVAQHMYALPAYAYLSDDVIASACLYVHHQFIAGFLMTGAFAHGAIFFVRDYDPAMNVDNVLSRVLSHKEAIISHLSWVSLFLGFHTLGIYIHNDVMVAFGVPEHQILIEPVLAQFVQAASGNTDYDFEVFLSDYDRLPYTNTVWFVWLPGWLDSVNDEFYSPFLTLGPGDFMVHHAIALGLHTTTLILVKGALDARGSRLMPDKAEFGYAFPCDGPGRGGTCDISGFDSFYLSLFWTLNTTSWVAFYFHWRVLDIGDAEFEEFSTFLMGWLAVYLWDYSALVVTGYGEAFVTDYSVWAWMFLFGHLVWATGFMFLIAWRGYWQEMMETLVWAHARTPIANLLIWQDAPVAMSIVQGRVIGLIHFTVGFILTFAPFLVASLLQVFGDDV